MLLTKYFQKYMLHATICARFFLCCDGRVSTQHRIPSVGARGGEPKGDHEGAAVATRFSVQVRIAHICNGRALRYPTNPA